MSLSHDEFVACDPRVDDEGTTTWTITLSSQQVGKLFWGHQYDRQTKKAHASMTALVWSGPLPEGHASPKSEHYGIHFDTGPESTPEEALASFAKRARRLIAWRESFFESLGQA